jgi:hypothetical protein
MKMACRYVNDFPLELNAEKILKGQGIDPARASERVFDCAVEIMADALRLLEPRAVYCIAPVTDFTHDRITFAGTGFEGKLVARALAGAVELAVALCTIGPNLENKVTELMGEGDAFRAMALDGAGVAAVREVSRVTAEAITRAAQEQGFHTGMKASPGQEGWPLEQQRVLFDLLPAKDLGVSLSESCLMIPRKSVSFVIGLGPEMREDNVPCDFCSKRERCRWRKKSPGQV